MKPGNLFFKVLNPTMVSTDEGEVVSTHLSKDGAFFRAFKERKKKWICTKEFSHPNP